MEKTAVYKLIKGHQEIFGDLFLNLEQQEKLTQLYDKCFELQKQHIIDAHINGQSEYDKGAYRKEVEDNSEYYYNETFNK
jgi:hypothetical protein